MAIINEKDVIDFIPVVENEDAKKITDSGLVKFNQIVLAVFNQIMMPKGTLSEFPEIGCYEFLLKLYFADSYATALQQIRENIGKFKRDQITIEAIVDPTEKSVNISISIYNIPGFKFSADLVKQNDGIKVVNPQVLKVI